MTFIGYSALTAPLLQIMLLFSLFTVGYIVGVLMTLFIFSNEQTSRRKISKRAVKQSNVWQVHQELVRPTITPIIDKHLL